jgi:hypothetical protein
MKDDLMSRSGAELPARLKSAALLRVGDGRMAAD